MIQRTVREPTGEEFTNHAVVYESEHEIGYAIWYPQMGGYVGKAVAVLARQQPEDGDGGCFEVYVWHDGEFPFNERDGKNPAGLHHCGAAQFIAFGESIKKLESNLRGDDQ